MKTFEIIFKEFHDSETFVMSRALLEDYKRQAAEAERERILNIIETNTIEGRLVHWREWSIMPAHLIERIKAEEEPSNLCVWCDRDMKDYLRSFNGKDICVDCEEDSLEALEKEKHEQE